MFVRSFVLSFVIPSRSWNYFQVLRASNLSGVYLTNHSSESIHIWIIGTLEGRLSFHDSSPQGPCPGVPVYLAPWTACPPGGKPTAVGLPPRGQAVPGYLTPRPGYLNPRGASCPGRFILPPANIKKILLCDVYYYLQHYNNYMQFLSYNYVNLNDYFKHSVRFLIDKGWGASCPGQFILPPT